MGVYTLKIDAELDGKYKEFRDRLKKHEKIVETKIQNDLMIIITEVQEPKKNILLG